MAHLVEDGEAVVEEVVEHVVEEVARAFREEILAQLLVVLATLEEPRHGQQLDVRQRHEVAVAEEEVELGGVQPLDGLVVDREVEDDEEVVGVLVDLRPLALGEHVLDVQRVPLEALGKLLGAGSIRNREVDPGEAVGAELSEPGLGPRDDLAGARATPGTGDARQLCHY